MESRGSAILLIYPKFYLLVLSLVLIGMCGCIPSEPKQSASTPEGVNTEDTPIVFPEPEIPATPVKANPTQTASGNATHALNINPLAKANVGTQVKPAPDGNGYLVEGSFGLEGTIRKVQANSEEWCFSASITFPSQDYSIGRLQAVPVGTMYVGGGQAQLKQDTNLLIISIPVRLPNQAASKDATPQKIPLELKFKATDKTQFTLSFIEG